jgi:release factor glutamine methyltransferase
MRIGQALKQAQQLGLPRLDAQLLLAHLLGRNRSWLLAHDDDALPAALVPFWQQRVQRRAGGEPLAYVVGEQDFCGLTLQVTPAVLIPRPETEDLVRWALECLGNCGTNEPRVLDLGTGSGAVALAIQQAQPQAQVWATDLSEPALQVAQANATRLGLAVRFEQGHWWALPRLDGLVFDLVVSNPPYVAAGDPHLRDLQAEPRQALVAGDTGLDDLRLLIAGAPARLRPGGWLLVEHGHDQADAVAQLMLQAGLQHPQRRTDLAGLPRCSGAQALARCGENTSDERESARNGRQID